MILITDSSPESTIQENALRRSEIQAAALSAIEVPLRIGEACIAALEPGLLLLPKVKYGVLGDLKIGLLVLKTSIEGSLTAAKINLSLIHDDSVVKKFQARVNTLQTKFDTIISGLR